MIVKPVEFFLALFIQQDHLSGVLKIGGPMQEVVECARSRARSLDVSSIKAKPNVELHEVSAYD